MQWPSSRRPSAMAEELDPRITRRYRELGDEEPARELDQAILAAAHRAAGQAHAPLVAPAGRHRWYFAFGALAILVLAVAITVQVDRRQLDPEALPPASDGRKSDERIESGQDAAQAKSERGVLADQAPAREPRRKNAQVPAPAASPPVKTPAKPQAAEAPRFDRFEAQPSEAKPAPQPAPQAETREPASALGRAEAPEDARQGAQSSAARTARAPQSADERAVLSSAIALP